MAGRATARPTSPALRFYPQSDTRADDRAETRRSTEDTGVPFSIVTAITFLTGFTNIRAFDIQMVEVALMAGLLLSMLRPRRVLTVTGAPVIINLLPLCLWAFFLIFLISLLSLRLTFYPPIGDFGPLKQAPWTTFIRFVQVVMAVSTLFIVALAIRADPSKFRKLLTAYVTCGYVSAVWGIISWLAWLSGLTLPGVTAVDQYGIARICGFFIEGGPFGVYIAGVMVVQVIRGYYLQYVSKRAFLIGMGLLSVAFVGAQSKAAVLLLIVLFIMYLFKIRRAGLVLLGILALVPLALTSNLAKGLHGYYDNFAHFEQAARERPDDYALLMGRLAAAVLMPRMIEEHPLLGIGIGNYSLMRNEPSVLRGLPRVELWDLNGLGLLGYMAELGIPLTLFILVIYAYPLAMAWKRRPWIVLLCTYPLLAALFGVQLYFAYPWVLAGLGLAAIEIDDHHRATQPTSTGSQRPVALSATSPTALTRIVDGNVQ